ncbi:peroxisomal membrane protein [Trichodelitschia bisporula]|uniref:Peroxisomal membrane protein n=1 Tax=Trichodelitschia bisporula TaxID=703511 RepID=A0A6G1I7M3_9PEZI|nr:peroxisomal membrane protein [Trichodelitschia bisporula]
MIASARQWLKRNRANFAIGAGVLGAGYLATNYVLGKVVETRQRMSDDRIAKENLRRRFEQNQEDCTFTVLAILPTATENVLEALPVEQILGELQRQKAERLSKSVGASEVSTVDQPSAPPSVTEDDQRSLTSFQSDSYVHASQLAEAGIAPGDASLRPPPLRSKKSKAQLWNDMKITSIARAFSLVYTLALLALLTRIQLNLLGRRNYLASVVSLASPPRQESGISLENHDDDNFDQAYGNDFDTNRKYLSFSWWLLHRGCKDIIEKVTAAVKEVFGPLNPREDITLQRLSELTVLVRKKVEGFTEEERKSHKWLSCLLPPTDQEDYVLQASGMVGPNEASPSSPALRRLLDETSDLIDSPAFTHVLTLILDSAFSLLIDTKVAALAYKIPPPSADPARVHEIVGPGSEAKAKVASTLAIFSRQAHIIGSGASNEYLTAMEGVKDLEAFAAVVYSSNFDFEPVDAGAATEGLEHNASTSSHPATSTAGATPAGPGRAAEVEELVPETVNGLDTIPELDMESAWGRATAQE